ncbi:MAG: alpha/beta fold hydrolase [Anaerolineae bacterium]
MKKVARILGSVVAVILLLIAIVPLLIPIPPLEDTVPPRELADADSRFIEVNGLDVHYKRTGAGEPTFLLLHGFGASTFSWREVMAPLGERGTVIAYDRPAFGLTERPLTWAEGENPYTPEAQVALVVGLLDALKIEQAILVGNSAGGTVAAATALAHPERVQALVLVDAAIYTGGGAPSLVQPLLQLPQFDRIGPLIARRLQAQGKAFLRRAWHDPDKITPEIEAGYWKPLRAQHWDKALWELTKASRASDLDRRLGELSTPTLVITGDDDRIVPTAQSLRLAEDLPNAELVVIPQCGHVPQEECPQAFMDAVRDFNATLPNP